MKIIFINMLHEMISSCNLLDFPSTVAIVIPAPEKQNEI